MLYTAFKLNIFLFAITDILLFQNTWLEWMVGKWCVILWSYKKYKVIIRNKNCNFIILDLEWMVGKWCVIYAVQSIKERWTISIALVIALVLYHKRITKLKISPGSKSVDTTRLIWVIEPIWNNTWQRGIASVAMPSLPQNRKFGLLFWTCAGIWNGGADVILISKSEFGLLSSTRRSYV